MNTSGQCFQCGERPRLPRGRTIRFAHNKLNFSLSASGNNCEGCIKDSLITKVEAVSDVVKPLGHGRAYVDWKAYSSLKNGNGKQDHSSPRFQKFSDIHQVLLAMGLLKFESGYEIVVPGQKFLNPMIESRVLYFNEAEEAMLYAQGLASESQRLIDITPKSERGSLPKWVDDWKVEVEWELRWVGEGKPKAWVLGPEQKLMAAS